MLSHSKCTIQLLQLEKKFSAFVVCYSQVVCKDRLPSLTSPGKASGPTSFSSNALLPPTAQTQSTSAMRGTENDEDENSSAVSSDFAPLPVASNLSDESKSRSTAWLQACQLSCSILELSATELSDLMNDAS